MLVYIAGCYRAKGDRTVEDHIQVARQMAIKLWDEGHYVICPHLNTAHLDRDCQNATDEQFLAGTLEMLRRCDAIMMLDNWRESEGAIAEHEYAQSVGMPIYYGDGMGEWATPLTEKRCPEQCKAFMDTVMKMYRLHLSKNADYCLAPGHKVLTGDLLWVPIENIQEGMTLVGFDEYATGLQNARRMFRPSIVESVGRVTLPSYRLTLADGQEFICSAQHPWLISQGSTGKWIITENLQPADKHPERASKLIKLLDPWEPATDYASGYLAAAFDGEGWFTQCSSTGRINGHKRGSSMILGFSQKENDMLAYVISLLEDRGLAYRVKPNPSEVYQIVLGKPRKEVIRLVGEIRPKRLLQNMSHHFGMIDLRGKVPLVKKEFIGDVELIALRTSTRTFVADGYATHNSPANILGTGEVGLITRLWDKVARLLNLYGFELKMQKAEFKGSRSPKHESIDDTLIDLATYGVIGQLLRSDKWGH